MRYFREKDELCHRPARSRHWIIASDKEGKRSIERFNTETGQCGTCVSFRIGAAVHLALHEFQLAAVAGWLAGKLVDGSGSSTLS